MQNQFLTALIQNKVLTVTAAVWAVAQCSKVFVGVFVEKRFNFKWFIGTGGMPSSHAAGATALATVCGLEHGFDSAVFAVAFSFAVVTMFDAQGVRRSTGQQAEILNKIIEDMYSRGNIESQKLKEFIGHTPVQVLIGMLLGAILAVTFYGMWYL